MIGKAAAAEAIRMILGAAQDAWIDQAPDCTRQDRFTGGETCYSQGEDVSDRCVPCSVLHHLGEAERLAGIARAAQ